jgi:hypothetical protein
MSAYFFLQDYINTGKIFFYKVIYNHFRVKNEIIIYVALLSIAALLLPGGSISYSRFSISLDSIQGSQCNISKDTQVTGLLERALLIIWDEVPM